MSKGYSKIPLYDVEAPPPPTRPFGGGMEQIRQQQREVELQDQSLDELSGAVARLKQVGHNIHHELVDQNRMLDDLTDNVENAQTMTEKLTKQTEELIKKSGGCGTVLTIIILILIAILLVLLIIYT